MGVELVEPQDLFVDDAKVWMRTTRGPQQVDVIYRRIDDDYIDPLTFRPDSMLGVPGLFDAYRAGRVTICSAPGAGVADDKAIYIYVPEMIRFYLGEEAILENIQTYQCRRADERRYVLEHLEETGCQGGSWLRRLRHADRTEKHKGRDLRLSQAHRGRTRPNSLPNQRLIFQPHRRLVKTACASGMLIFRPFCLVGKTIRLVPGGLTRVALREGSLVVNSSQGGGGQGYLGVAGIEIC